MKEVCSFAALPLTSLGPHCFPAWRLQRNREENSRAAVMGLSVIFPGLASVCSASPAPQGARSLVVQELDLISNPITELPDVLGDRRDSKPFLIPSQLLLEERAHLPTGGVNRNPD